MDALLSTLIAVLLVEQGDKLQLLAIALADSGRRRIAVWLGLVVAAGGNAAIAASAGQLLHATVPFRALTLLMALALLSAAAGAIVHAKPSTVVAYPRLGAFGGPAFAGFVLGFGSSAQFLVFALAARADSLVLATIGATLGTALALAPAVMLGAGWARAVPLHAIRIGAGTIFAIAGIVAGVSALRLV